MIMDFINEEISNVEEVSALESMCIMLGEDYDSAMEADETVNTEVNKKFGEKIKSIAGKIKDFILKVINWIKTKFQNLLKKETITMNKNKWKDGNDVLKAIDKADLNDLSRIINAIRLIKSDSATVEKLGQLKIKLDAAADKVNKAINEVESSTAFINLFQDTYDSDEKNMVKANVKSLSTQQSKLKVALSGLSDAEKALQSSSQEQISAISKFASMAIRVTNIRIKVINKLLNA